MGKALKKTMALALCAVMIVAVSAVPAFSQGQTGTLTGRVSDASGALIPGVTVTISSPEMPAGDRVEFTNEQGAYRAAQLPNGFFRIVFELPGFQTIVQEQVQVGVGRTVTINADLQVATVAETITVVGSTPAIDLEQANVAVNVNEAILEDIPRANSLNGLFQALPGFYSTFYDVGGSTVGTSSNGSFMTYGRSGDTEVVVDGIVKGGHYNNFYAFEEIQVVGAAKGAEAANQGVYMNAVIKSGTNDWHGSIYADWQDSSFQANNVDAALLAKGLPGAAGFSRFNEFSGDIGGPIIRDKFWFYFAHMDQYSGKTEAGFVDNAGQEAIAFTKLQNPTLKMTYQVNDSQKVDFLWELGRKYQPFRHSFSAAEFIPAESTQVQDSWSAIGKFSWQWIASPTTTVDAQLSRWGYWWPRGSHEETANTVSERDLESGYVRGGYSGTGSGSSQGTPSYGHPIRWQWDLNMNHFATFGDQTHEIKAGYRGWNYRSSEESRGTVNQQIYYYDTAGCGARACSFVTPNYVRVYGTPNREINKQDQTSIFFNDSWKINRNLTLNVGARFTRYKTSYPDQGNTGAGPYAIKATIAAKDFEATNHLAPRVSFVYDITGQGTMALKASYGRYYNDSSTNPARIANPNATPRWRYTWDGSIPFVVNRGVDGIIGTSDDPDLIRTEAGSSATVPVIDPDLKNDYTDEFTG